MLLDSAAPTAEDNTIYKSQCWHANDAKADVAVLVYHDDYRANRQSNATLPIYAANSYLSVVDLVRNRINAAHRINPVQMAHDAGAIY